MKESQRAPGPKTIHRTWARGPGALSRNGQQTSIRQQDGSRAPGKAGRPGWRGPGAASRSASGVGNTEPHSWRGHEMTEGDASLTWTTFARPPIWEAGHGGSAVTKRHREGLPSNGRRGQRVVSTGHRAQGHVTPGDTRQTPPEGSSVTSHLISRDRIFSKGKFCNRGPRLTIISRTWRDDDPGKAGRPSGTEPGPRVTRRSTLSIIA